MLNLSSLGLLVALIMGAAWMSSSQQVRSQQKYSATNQRKLQRSRQLSTQSQIVNRILNDATYDVNSRPPVKEFAEHSAIVVITSIYISRIVWNKNSAAVDLYLRQQWEDSRLSYEVDPREGVHEVPLPRGRRIWRPDTFFIGAEEDVVEEQRTRVVVEPSGHVRVSERRTVTLSTEDIGAFPFSDRKSFMLKLSSFNYPIDDVVYLWANSPPRVLPVEVSEELLASDRTEYAFENAIAGDCVGNYSIGSYSCISVSVTFSGHSSCGLFTVFLPCVLLILVSWLHFWIHGSWSVPRTFSAAMPFFIFFAILFFWPTTSKATKVWLVFCTLITFFSLIEYFLVICCGMHRRVQFASNGLPTIANGGSTTVQTTKKYIHNTDYDNEHTNSYYRQNPGERTSHEHEPLTEVTTTTAMEPTVRGDGQHNVFTSVQVNNRIDIVSRILFPVVFLVFLIIFTIFFLL